MKVPEKTPALSVAGYFVDIANKNKEVITHKKLQKLVYYAQAWSLVLQGKTLFHETIQAWVHGPVVRAVYKEYKQYGAEAIKKTVEASVVSKIPQSEKNLLDEVWKIYGKFDSRYLEMLTHSEKPWQEARAGLDVSQNSENEIKVDSMKSFYSDKLKEAKQAIAKK